MTRATTPVVRRVLGGAAAAAVLTVTLAGCSVIGGLFNQDNVFEIKVGDCFNQPDTNAEEVTSVTFVDCTQPHDYEATKSIIMTDSVHPGDDAVHSRAEAECVAAFSEYTGQSYDTFTDYEFNYYVPTQSSWAGGDREILCLIEMVDDRSTISVKNFAG